ncbi:MAG: C40 family peptidase [Ignavibacteriaceae bacterium]|nr:C40 family peptidase [Ignavibacteriaceae bacterium]
MKSLIFIYFIIIMVKTTSAQVDPETVSKILKNLSEEYAPDKRTAIFKVDYSIENSIITFSGETNIPEAKKKLLNSFLQTQIIDQIHLLPSKELGDRVYGIVNLSVANVRTKPSHSAELATQVMLGTQLRILKSEGEWYLVQGEDDYIGWLDDDGVCVMNKEQFQNWIYNEKVIITVPFEFVYTKPSLLSATLSDIVIGNLLLRKSEVDGFTEVEFPDGRIGYINSQCSENYQSWLHNRSADFANIYRAAQKMMGIPYLWGGTSIKGLDCSGFTKLVFQLNGILLPRDASQQVHVGEPVDTENGFENLLPGDLLFFGYKDPVSMNERITHVAIYIGNLDFLHSSGRVRLNSLDKSKSYFAEDRLKTFIRAKRILSSIGTNGVKSIKELSNN